MTTLLLTAVFFMTNICLALPTGFVYLHEIDPTIVISPRYTTQENFVGQPIQGYHEPTIILTNQAAQALKKVQEEVSKDGYSLVIYDAYRPQQAVDHFVHWSSDVSNQIKKSQYYPRVDKTKVFELGYVAKHSGHSRGSTVDLTLIERGKSLHPIVEKKRILLDGYTITILDDGTLDMGSSFDLFDVASHDNSSLIESKFKKRRVYLKNIMGKYGFTVSPREWWHFTLNNEPYPDSYFNFRVE